jgi:hypothetical protein
LPSRSQRLPDGSRRSGAVGDVIRRRIEKAMSDFRFQISDLTQALEPRDFEFEIFNLQSEI